MFSPVALLEELRNDLPTTHSCLSCTTTTFRSRIFVAYDSSSYR